MLAALAAETDYSTAVRYEALIRISNSIRAGKESRELFEILAHELGKVLPFDAIAQFDETSNKIHWRMGPTCPKHKDAPLEFNREETLAGYVYREQRPVVLGSLEG